MTGTVNAIDGGTASATASGINIDLSPPARIKVQSASDGATYAFADRKRTLTCTATDHQSGVASCVVTRTKVKHKRYVVVSYTATATNHAGGHRSVAGSYRYLRSQ